MHLPDVANSPRLLTLGGSAYRVSAATLADFGEMIAFVEDRVVPPREKPCAPFSSPEAQDALFGPEGLPLVAFLALRRHQPGTTLAGASALALSLEPAEVAALAGAFFRRRKAFSPGDDGDGSSRDLVDVAWGQQIELLCRRPGWTYGRALGLSLDQYENAASRGNADAPWEGREVGLSEAQALWEEAMGE